MAGPTGDAAARLDHWKLESFLPARVLCAEWIILTLAFQGCHDLRQIAAVLGHSFVATLSECLLVHGRPIVVHVLTGGGHAILDELVLQNSLVFHSVVIQVESRLQATNDVA